MEVNAYSVAEIIDLNKFAQAYDGQPLLASQRELLYKSGKNSWFAVYAFGALAFAGMSPVDEESLMRLAGGAVENGHREPLSEDHTVKIGRAAFGTSVLTVPKIDIEVLRIVMQNIAYSVTLDHYRRVAANLLDEVKQHAAELEVRGKIKLREKNLNRFIGRVLNIKNRIAEHFYIFADLDLIWENDFLTRVHRGTVKSLDLKARFEQVENSFKIIEENLHMFNEFHMHGQSYRIEIIITLLIVVEVLDLIANKFKFLH